MDLTALATSLVDVIGDALTAAAPVAALVIGATVGYRLFKRFAKG